MALSLEGYRLTANVMDVGRNVSRKVYEMTAITMIAAVADAAIILAALNAFTDGVVASYTIAEVWSDDALVYPAAGVQVENQGQLSVELETDNKKATLRVPAVTDAVMQTATGPGNNIIDIADVIVTNYAALFATGGQATLSDGELLASTLSGKRIHVKNNNG